MVLDSANLFFGEVTTEYDFSVGGEADISETDPGAWDEYRNWIYYYFTSPINSYWGNCI